MVSRISGSHEPPPVQSRDVQRLRPRKRLAEVINTSSCFLFVAFRVERGDAFSRFRMSENEVLE